VGERMNSAEGRKVGERGLTTRRMSGWETESLREGRVDIYRPSPIPLYRPRRHPPVSRPHRATTYHHPPRCVAAVADRPSPFATLARARPCPTQRYVAS